MSLNKIVFSLVFSALIVFGFNLFFLRNNIDTFVNRHVIQSTVQELEQIEVAVVDYLEGQVDRIDSLSQLAILEALERREFTTDDIARIRQSLQQILENNAALQYVRIIDVESYQLLYSTNDTDIVGVSTETIQYRTLTSLVSPIEETLLNKVTETSTPLVADSDTPLYFVQMDGVQNRLILAVPLLSTGSEQALLAVSYYAIDRLQGVLLDISDIARSLVGVDSGIIVNPIPSINYHQSINEPIASHTTIQLSDGTEYVALTKETPLKLSLYAFISQQQLAVSPVANIVVLGAVGSMLFVIMLFIMNISQGNEVYIKNHLSVFRKKLLRLVNESPDFRDFELLNRLTMQKETLCAKIISNLKGGDENNRKLFDAGWQRLLATLQFHGVLDASSVRQQFEERYPSRTQQSNPATSETSQSTTPDSQTDSVDVHTVDSVAGIEKVEPLTIQESPENVLEEIGDAPPSLDRTSAQLHDVADSSAELPPPLHYIAPQSTSVTTSPPDDAVVRTKGLLYKALIKNIQPTTERDGIVKISQLLISHQQNQSTKIDDKEMSELIDTLSV